MSLFQKAVKEDAKLRLAITGPSGSGKTYTALAVATELAAGGPVAFVDTEHGSASKYADQFSFDVINMTPPFHPDRFVSYIAEAAKAGYKVVVLDSLTHAWSGTGGVLDVVDEAAKRSKSGNTYMAWKEGTPVQNKLIETIVGSNIHIIATMRSKTEYILETNSKGQQAPKKVGMAAQQRDGFEYEFDIVIDMDIDHNGIVSKSRATAIADKVFPKPGAQFAGLVKDWLRGAPVSPKGGDQHVNGNANGNGGAQATGSDSPVAAWTGPNDALSWAMGAGFFANLNDAREHMKIVAEMHGGLKSSNMKQVFADFYKTLMERSADFQDDGNPFDEQPAPDAEAEAA